MPSNELTFRVKQMLTHVDLGTLDPKTWAFNSPIFDNGSCEMKLAIDGRRAESLRARSVPNERELYIQDDVGTYLWGGWINFRDPDPAAAILTVKASNWRSWFYKRKFDAPQYHNAGENDIIAFLVTWAMQAPGAPQFVVSNRVAGEPNNGAGKIRELTVQADWTVGQALDRLANADNGFEWDILIRDNATTGLPEFVFEKWGQGATRSGRQALMLDSTQSTNRVSVGPMPEDGTQAATKVWATGEGQPPDQPRVADVDPALAGGQKLLLETTTNWSGVTNPTTLFNHARAERISRSAPTAQVSVSIPYNKPALSQYRSGDRARLKIRDAWRNIDADGIRIVDRAVSKAAGKLPLATLVLDMLDQRNV